MAHTKTTHMRKSMDTSTKPTSKKRKHEDTEPTPSPTTKQAGPPKESADTTPPTKKSRSTSNLAHDPTIALLSPSALSTKFTQTLKSHRTDLSPIELDDLSLIPSCFRDTTSFADPHIPEHLPAFLTTHTPGGLKTLQTCSNPASPHTLLLTSSAIRCTHLLRPLRPFGTKDSKLAKLFAKHMKLPAMESYVRSTTFGIAAGTPGRVLNLAKSGVLKVDGLKRVVLDASYLDEKGRGIWGDKETWGRIVEFVNLDGVKGGLVKGEMEVLMF